MCLAVLLAAVKTVLVMVFAPYEAFWVECQGAWAANSAEAIAAIGTKYNRVASV
jgi:hypothetical protein